MTPAEREALTRTFIRYKDLLTKEMPGPFREE